MRRVVTHVEAWPCRTPFRITGHVFNEFACVICEIEQDGEIGRGEAMGVYYLKETPASMMAQIEAVMSAIESGIDREALLSLLPPGGARNAVDSALWDVEAKLTGVSAWRRAGVSTAPVDTVFTIGLEDEPEAMASKASAATDISLFKVKLNDDRPVERIAAIRAVQPDATLVVDANEAWSIAGLERYAPALARHGVAMIEQPLPRGGDEALADYDAPLPLCADESCLHLAELEPMRGRYQMINIKLDKTGGLTHALELADAAEAAGFGLMVGCMGGTSLAMAPAHVLAQRCRYVDIDGPLLCRRDRPQGFSYDGGRVSLPERPFWGVPASAP